MQKTLLLLLAAAAGYGIYKYSKMSTSEKNDLREKGRDFLDKKMGLSHLTGKRQTARSGR